MLRTFIQITALSLVLISSYFLIRGVVYLTAQKIIKLSQTPYGGTYRVMVKSLTQQKADTIVGFVLLLASFLISLINFLWPMRFDDFGVSIAGVVAALLGSAVILFLGMKCSNLLQHRWNDQIEEMLKEG